MLSETQARAASCSEQKNCSQRFIATAWCSSRRLKLALVGEFAHELLLVTARSPHCHIGLGCDSLAKVQHANV